jgi:hypothetical protein
VTSSSTEFKSSPGLWTSNGLFPRSCFDHWTDELDVTLGTGWSPALASSKKSITLITGYFAGPHDSIVVWDPKVHVKVEILPITQGVLYYIIILHHSFVRNRNDKVTSQGNQPGPHTSWCIFSSYAAFSGREIWPGAAIWLRRRDPAGGRLNNNNILYYIIYRIVICIRARTMHRSCYA